MTLKRLSHSGRALLRSLGVHRVASRRPSAIACNTYFFLSGGSADKDLIPPLLSVGISCSSENTKGLVLSLLIGLPALIPFPNSIITRDSRRVASWRLSLSSDTPSSITLSMFSSDAPLTFIPLFKIKYGCGHCRFYRL